ncbi:MAG: hypothetical protein EB127_00935 [Alphaproteobacteria bacterium]|nr:hypothetical protein [Alphaproteobacteria bacterium]
MSSEEGVNVTLEQMFAAVLQTTGKISITRDNLLKNYERANIRVEEIDNDTVTFELHFMEVDNDSRAISEDGA